MLRGQRRILRLLVTAFVLAALGAGSLAAAGATTTRHRRSADSAGPIETGTCDRNHFSAWDEEWLMMSIQGDRFEIEGGNLAQKKAATQIVRDLGARLVKDHTVSLRAAVALAKDLGIDVPDSPSPLQQWALRAVAQFSGNQFDRAYTDLEVQDHVQDIQEAEDEVSKGCNPRVRQNAKENLPVLREHLRLAREALAAVGGPLGS
jgi:putative membrane protein